MAGHAGVEGSSRCRLGGTGGTACAARLALQALEAACRLLAVELAARAQAAKAALARGASSGQAGDALVERRGVLAVRKAQTASSLRAAAAWRDLGAAAEAGRLCSRRRQHGAALAVNLGLRLGEAGDAAVVARARHLLARRAGVVEVRFVAAVVRGGGTCHLGEESVEALDTLGGVGGSRTGDAAAREALALGSNAVHAGALRGCCQCGGSAWIGNASCTGLPVQHTVHTPAEKAGSSRIRLLTPQHRVYETTS